MTGVQTCALPISMGFSRQEYWSGLPLAPPGDLPIPEPEPVSHARSEERRVGKECNSKNQVMEICINGDHFLVSSIISRQSNLMKSFKELKKRYRH